MEAVAKGWASQRVCSSKGWKRRSDAEWAMRQIYRIVGVKRRKSEIKRDREKQNIREWETEKLEGWMWVERKAWAEREKQRWKIGRGSKRHREWDRERERERMRERRSSSSQRSNIQRNVPAGWALIGIWIRSLSFPDTPINYPTYHLPRKAPLQFVATVRSVTPSWKRWCAPFEANEHDEVQSVGFKATRLRSICRDSIYATLN